MHDLTAANPVACWTFAAEAPLHADGDGPVLQVAGGAPACQATGGVHLADGDWVAVPTIGSWQRLARVQADQPAPAPTRP